MSCVSERCGLRCCVPSRHRALALAPLLVLALVLVSVVAPLSAVGSPPVANAGPDQTVTAGVYVTFDGTASSGDVGIVSYTWTFVYGNVSRTLEGAVNSSFQFVIPGTYEVTLTVTDAEGNHSSDTMVLTVNKVRVNVFVAYWWAFLMLGAAVGILVLLLLIMYSDLSFVPEPTREKTRLLVKRLLEISKQVIRHRMGFVGVVILVFFFALAIFGPSLAPYDVDAKTSGQFVPYLLPSKMHWMGTDSRGFDIFSELLHGARTSIIVGVFAAIIASFLGAAIGLYSGFVGGWKDEAIMRVNDVILSIPWLVLMILLAAMVGKISLFTLIIIIGVTGWSGTARLVRAQVMSLRERQYIERARAIGSSDMHIINKHILPNAFPLVFANTILTVAISILSEATLSFLKMRPEGTVTWGTMLSYAQESTALQIGLHWWIIAPGLCIVFLVLGFTLLGHALDEITNPRLRRR